MLDLTTPTTFRKFSLPMGAQTEERLVGYIDRYNMTKEDPTGIYTVGVKKNFRTVAFSRR